MQSISGVNRAAIVALIMHFILLYCDHLATLSLRQRLAEKRQPKTRRRPPLYLHLHLVIFISSLPASIGPLLEGKKKRSTWFLIVCLEIYFPFISFRTIPDHRTSTNDEGCHVLNDQHNREIKPFGGWQHLIILRFQWMRFITLLSYFVVLLQMRIHTFTFRRCSGRTL